MSEIIVIQQSTEVVEVSTPGVPGPAGTGVPVGGTTGQALVKNSNTNFDTEWDDVLTLAAVQASFQPLDSDLTAIAALATTSFGRGLLELANQAALLSAAGAAAASHAHAGEDITSGTVADARIASTIARDSEVTSAVAALSTVYQPLDSDLTSIAALTTTSFGRSVLALADQAALLSAAGAAAASHAHAGEDITSGTVADARIASTIARDSEVSSAISTSESGQVRDGDAAGGVLGGTYPNPSFAADMATQAELDAHISDATAAHAASAISVDSTDLDGTGTDLQTVLEELEDQIGSGGGTGEALQREVSQTAHGLSVGNIVRHNGTSFVKAQADTADHAEVVGLVSEVADVNTFTLHYGGRITGLSSLTAGVVYYLDDDTAGLLTATEPTDSGDISKPVLIADSTTSGYFVNLRGMSGGSSGGGGGTFGQTHIMIHAFATPGSESGFDNLFADSTAAPAFGTRYSDNADGSSITWPVQLLEGTYALSMGSIRYSGSGIVRFALDDGGGFVDVDDSPYDGSAATVDTYGTDGIARPYEVCADLTIPATGTYLLRATIDGKNASSSGYATNIVYVSLNARSLA